MSSYELMAQKTDIIFPEDKIIRQCIDKVIANQEKMTICNICQFLNIMPYCVLSIIIVNYNTREFLENCLNSLFLHCKEEIESGKYEIIIVDNASSDDSPEFLSKFCRERSRPFPTTAIQILNNKENVGFAKANNQGIKIARGKVILLLNSDTEVKSGTIQGCLKFLKDNLKEDLKEYKGEEKKDKRIGILTCKVLIGNGEIDPACHRGFPTPWNALCYFLGLEKIFPKVKVFSGYHQYYRDLSVQHEVDAISGAFFMIKRETINKIGLLDEDYFMYAEDLDWCYRAKSQGFSVWYNPQFEIIHYKKQSGRAAKNMFVRKKVQKHFWSTMRIFYEKHYVKKYPKIINKIIIFLLKSVETRDLRV